MHGSSETAGDRRDRVRVVAAADGALEDVDQHGAVRDCRPRRLQRSPRAAGGREVAGLYAQGRYASLSGMAHRAALLLRSAPSLSGMDEGTQAVPSSGNTGVAT